MKSLSVVTILALLLGAGFWKYKNPEGTIDDARDQAGQLYNRVLQGVSTRAGGNSTGNASQVVSRQDFAGLAEEANAELREQLAKTTSRLNALEEQLGAQAADTGNSPANPDFQSQLNVMAEELQSDYNARLDALTQRLDTLPAAGVAASGTPARNSAARNSAAQNSAAQNSAAQNSAAQGSAAQSSATQNSSVPDSSVQAATMQALPETYTAALDVVAAGFDSKLAAIQEELGALGRQQAELRRAAAQVAAPSVASTNATGSDTASGAATAPAANPQPASTQTAPEPTRFAGQASALASFNENLLALSTRVAALEAAPSTVEQSPSPSAESTDIAAFQTALNTTGNRVRELESRLETLTSRVESSSIENSQSALQQQLAELEARLQASPGETVDIEALVSSLDQSRARIQLLEQRVSDLPASTESEAAKAAQEILQSRIDELQSTLQTSAGAPEEIVSTLTEVQQKVSALESRNFVTAEDLQKLSETKSVQYKIFFDSGQVDITAAGQKALDEFIEKESSRATHVSIFGTADRRGSSEYNQQLALRRAHRVRSYLIQNGYDFSRIDAVDGIGEDLAAVKTADGEADPDQRSVIIFAFQP